MRFSPWILLVLSLGCLTMEASRTVRVRAGDGKMCGVYLATTRPGFTGAGYVTGFEKPTDRLDLMVTAPAAGVYDIALRYCSPKSKKYIHLRVNGLLLQIKLPQTDGRFHRLHIGKVELAGGENSIVVEPGWGFFDLDSIELDPLDPLPALVKPALVLSDPQATPETTALMRGLFKDYGAITASGVYSESDARWVNQLIGARPVILGSDLMQFSPSRREHGARIDGIISPLMQDAQTGRVITLSWHWNAPAKLLDADWVINSRGEGFDARWYKGFNTSATTFDLEAAMADETSAQYQLLLRDIDAIAVPLRQLADAHIPVLWRPLHEAEQGWFWWGARGPWAYVKLWRLLHDRLTRVHQLHNLIWVYTSDGDIGWYPGDDVVDIVSADIYPADTADPCSQTWDELDERFGGRKLLALSEFGGMPDVSHMIRLGCRWSYFVSWHDAEGLRKDSPATIQSRYMDLKIRRAP